MSGTENVAGKLVVMGKDKDDCEIASSPQLIFQCNVLF